MDSWERDVRWLLNVIERIEAEKGNALADADNLRYKIKVLEDALAESNRENDLVQLRAKLTREPILWGDEDSDWTLVYGRYKCRHCGETVPVFHTRDDDPYKALVYHEHKDDLKDR